MWLWRSSRQVHWCNLIGLKVQTVIMISVLISVWGDWLNPTMLVLCCVVSYSNCYLQLTTSRLLFNAYGLLLSNPSIHRGVHVFCVLSWYCYRTVCFWRLEEFSYPSYNFLLTLFSDNWIIPFKLFNTMVLVHNVNVKSVYQTQSPHAKGNLTKSKLGMWIFI